MTQTDLQQPILTTPFRAVADLSFDAISNTRSNAPSGPEIVYLNDALRPLNGYPAECVVGQRPGILQGPQTD